MYKVELPQDSEISRPVRTLLVFRFWAVSVLYILSFGIAVGALAFYLTQAIETKISDADWKALLGFFGGSAGFGSYLVRLDRRERQSVERDEALYLLREKSSKIPEIPSCRTNIKLCSAPGPEESWNSWRSAISLTSPSRQG